MRKVLFITALLLPAVIITAFYSGNSTVDTVEEEIISIHNLIEIPALPGKDQYGFIIEDVEVIEDRVNRNESLYIILNRYGVSPQMIHSIQQQARGIVNLNRMIPGQKYRIYKREGEVTTFIWHQNHLQYVVFNWENEIEIKQGEIPVETRIAKTAGIISTSLYDAVQSERVSQRLGVELAEVFGWEIDFFALRQGDHFKAIYENRYAGGEYIGIGDIKAAEFQHRGQTHRAYFFDNGVRMGYFDQDGNSLQKELLKAPFRYNQRVSSGFSNNRFHPILQQNRPHHGIDYAAPIGTPVISVGDGVVIEAQRRGGNGNIVQIRHNSTYKTSYLHLNGFAPGIRRGVEVAQGQVIGYVGQTGLATGPHLCYRLYVNDRPVNSLRVDLPASESLEEEFMEEFQQVVREKDILLDQLQFSENLALK
jgi:murein DD-endopeptidase MepM/ murein hydrolase activator NlpD